MDLQSAYRRGDRKTLNLTHGAIVFAAAFLVTFASVPLAKRLAALLGAIDYPGNRRMNSAPIPRCGGIALFLGLHAGVLTLIIGILFFGWEINDLYTLSDIDYPVFYAGVVVMFAVGLVDDITQLSAWAKLAGQILASVIVVLSGVSFVAMRMVITGEFIELGWWDYPISVLYLLVFINITNLIDGLDGLASGIVAIVSAGLLYLVVTRGNMTLAFLCISLIAVCLAFLRYNFFPASVFMGDSGSMLLGLLLGAISIAGVARTQSFIIMVVPLAIAGVPVLDTMSAIVRRLRGHQHISEADTDHIHHRLMQTGLGQRKSVLALWLCSALLACIGCVIPFFSGLVRWIIFAVLLIIVFFVIWRFGLFKPVLKHHYDNRGKTGPRLPKEK